MSTCFLPRDLFALAAASTLGFTATSPGADNLPGTHDALVPEPALVLLNVSPTSEGITQEDAAPPDRRFASARTFKVTAPGPQHWSQEANLTIPTAVKKGDVCLVRFWVKGKAPGNESGEAHFSVYAQKGAPEWDKSLERTMSAASEWKEVKVPFAWQADYEAGECMLGFGFGLQAQEVTIAGLELLRFDRTVTVEDLPSTGSDYRGREPDAAWRDEAAERIRRHRMERLKIKVVNKAGAPVAGAQVEVRMRKHAFAFGTAVQLSRLLSEEAPDERYRQRLLELFNAAGTENALKWPAWDGEWGPQFSRENTLEALTWFKDHVIPVRGHVLVWPGWRNLPRSVQALRDTPDRIPAAVAEHIEDILSATGDLVGEWDVINEPYSNTDLEQLLGRDLFIDWFKQARAVRPHAGLYLNDYSILSAGGFDQAHQAHFEEMIHFLQRGGAPITGIGMQGHFGGNVTPPARVVQILDRFAKTGLNIRITEFDVDTPDEQLKADYLRDFLTACFSHPSVVGVQVWGFWEQAHWKPRAAWFTSDWTPLPVVDAYTRLVFDQWWTEEDLVTGEDGTASVDGFLGAYAVTASADGQSATTDHALVKGAKDLIIKLKD